MVLPSACLVVVFHTYNLLARESDQQDKLVFTYLKDLGTDSVGTHFSFFDSSALTLELLFGALLNL